MDIKNALKEQNHAALAMLAQCVELCPDDLWMEELIQADPPAGFKKPEWPAVNRTYWRIAFHAAMFGHLYMEQEVSDFSPPPEHLERFTDLWTTGTPVDEPFEFPADTVPPSQADVLGYIKWIDDRVDSVIDGLDLDREDCGFPWYRNISKLSHSMLSFRHVQGHIGQLSELLMSRGIDVDWSAKG
jgi:hypothetical protein